VRTLFHEIIARPTAKTPSSSNANRQTPCSLRVSRSRSNATEVDSAEVSARGVDILVIGQMNLEGASSSVGEQEVNLATEVWTQTQIAAMDLQKENSEMDNSLWITKWAVRWIGLPQYFLR
jgi:hypothetical protein